MTFLFIDYANEVVKAYEERRDANLLSPLLMHPTTANIRQECLNVYTERLKKGERLEENTLKAFFGVPPTGRNFDYVIERHNADKFRQLQKLISRRIQTPSPIYVELLAWLIDFTPRPLAQAQKVYGGTNKINNPVTFIQEEGGRKPEEIEKGTNAGEIKGIISGTSTEINPEEEGKTAVKGYEGDCKPLVIKTKKKAGNSKLKAAAAIVLVIAILSGGVYVILQQIKPGEMPYGNVNTGCMYWAGDQYEKTPCNDQRKGRQLFPLNNEMMKNFKRITKEDTITERSIGIIHYISIDNNKEYYTTGGNHPVDITRVLKPLSRYIFEKHLRKKEVSVRDSLPE